MFYLIMDIASLKMTLLTCRNINQEDEMGGACITHGTANSGYKASPEETNPEMQA
jgi:hypothetical protein